jgi:hypothetical protein
MIHVQCTKALQGDIKATRLIFDLITKLLPDDQALAMPKESGMSDTKILQRFAAAIKEEGTGGNGND